MQKTWVYTSEQNVERFKALGYQEVDEVSDGGLASLERESAAAAALDNLPDDVVYFGFYETTRVPGPDGNSLVTWVFGCDGQVLCTALKVDGEYIMAVSGRGKTPVGDRANFRRRVSVIEKARRLAHEAVSSGVID